jgi:predicted ATPase
MERLSYALEEEGTTAQTVAQTCQQLVDSVKGFFAQMEYLGPVRPAPKRVYALDHAEVERWQRRGIGNYLSFLQENLNEVQATEVNEWLVRLNLGVAAHVTTSEPVEGASLSSIKLQENEEDSSKDHVNIVDTGYGASQVLPIIVQVVTAQPGQTIIIEQPELHLHPRAQAELADLFIQVGQSGRAHLLIETHSEHLLLRLQRRMAERFIDSLDKEKLQGEQKELRVIFVVRSKGGVSSTENLSVDHRGQLISPPDGFLDFFDYDYRDALELNKAIAKISEIELVNE